MGMKEKFLIISENINWAEETDAFIKAIKKFTTSSEALVCDMKSTANSFGISGDDDVVVAIRKDMEKSITSIEQNIMKIDSLTPELEIAKAGYIKVANKLWMN